MDAATWTVIQLTAELAALSTVLLLLLGTPLAWWLAIPMGMGLTGLLWAVIVASLISCGLLLARFWMLSRRGL